MSRPARSDLFAANEINRLLLSSRCVRESRLMGIDSSTGKNYEHRRAWLEKRIRRLALQFAIEVQSFSIRDNEVIFIVRNRPDWVKSWSDREIVYRWLMICPKRKNKLGEPKEPKEEEIISILQNQNLMLEIRSRLSDPSWWMRLILQPLAARANIEENLTGGFWQGRYQSLVLLDDASAIAASVFTEIASIRDELRKSLRDSIYSSLRDRWEDFLNDSPHLANKSFLCSMYRKGSCFSASSSILPVTLEDYLDLIEWTRSSLIRVTSSDSKEPHVTPHRTLDAYGISVDLWLLMATDFNRIFYLFAGMRDMLLNYHRKNLNHRCNVRLEFRSLFMIAA